MSGGAPVQEAIRQVRREARRLREVRKALEGMQAAVAAPSPQELTEMAHGLSPLSAEAHLLGVLQRAINALKNVEADLRFDLDAKALWKLEKDWQQGHRRAETDLKLIREALSARNA